MARTIEEFVNATEFAGGDLKKLAGDASARRYARVALGGKTAMVMDTPPEGENFPAFVQIAEHLLNAGYSAPKVMARDMENGFLLLEDLGDDSFSKLCCHLALVAGSEFENNISTRPRYKNGVTELELYETAIDLLAEWKINTRHSREGGNLFLQIPAFAGMTKNTYLREVSLFPDWYLPRIFSEEKVANLRAEYMQIWEEILANSALAQNIFVHRDFHADNLMWLPEREGVKKVGLLDFQDALLGDAAYDMVSLLEDARRDVAPELAQKMIERYLQQTDVDEKKFRNSYSILGAQRNLKIIGIFVRLFVRDGKENYLRFLPRVWAHLERDLQHESLKVLRKWLDKNVPAEFRK